jgi:diguanylate cyclase (GGDEF)-like protein
MLAPALLDRSLTERPVLRTRGFTLLLAAAVCGAIGALNGGLSLSMGAPATWDTGAAGLERLSAGLLALAAIAALARSHRTLRLAVAERSRAESIARTEAITDELTGLYNRRGFRALAEHQLRIARRNGTDALLLFVDLDDFKPINDRFGHAEGDRALCDVASLLRGTVRETDLVGRVGGDEFVVFVVDADRQTEHAVRARLQQALAFRNLGVARPYALALSVGVARFDHDRSGGLEALLQRADASLYQAKRVRRLQVA